MGGCEAGRGGGRAWGPRPFVRLLLPFPGEGPWDMFALRGGGGQEGDQAVRGRDGGEEDADAGPGFVRVRAARGWPCAPMRLHTCARPNRRLVCLARVHDHAVSQSASLAAPL